MSTNRALTTRAARGVLVIGAVIALLGVHGSATTAAGAATTTTVRVTPSDVAPGGSWSSPSGSDTGTVGFVVGPAAPPSGSGSLAMSVASSSEHRSFYDYEYGSCATSSACTGPGTPLTQVSALKYSTFRQASSTMSNVVPTLNVEIDPDSTTSAGVNYATLVWEPLVNGLTVSDGVWQSWDAYAGGSGRWYSTANLGAYGVLSCPAFSCSATWSQIVTALPNGIIKYGLGPNVGSGWSGFAGNVDRLVVGIGTDTKTFDFEQPPRVSVGDTAIYEGDHGRRTARVMVSLDQVAPPGGVTATWATHGGSATSGVDFKGRTGRLYFKAGQTTRYAQVKIIPDGAVEGDEQFTVQLSAVEGADIADGTGTVTILDEEGSSPSGISVGSSSVVEGQSGGSRYVWVPVTLAGKNAAAVTVHYATGGGTAVAPDDYLGHAGTLTFPPKAVVRWVLVYITADQVTEGNETLNVTLSSPIGGTIVHGTGTVTIVDDD